MQRTAPSVSLPAFMEGFCDGGLSVGASYKNLKLKPRKIEVDVISHRKRRNLTGNIGNCLGLHGGVIPFLQPRKRCSELHFCRLMFGLFSSIFQGVEL